MCQAINKVLTVAVPKAYRRAGGLVSLQRRYRKRTPAEKEEATLQ